VNPFHGKLVARRWSLAEMADLIEGHVGSGANLVACKEVFDALQRVRKDSHNFYIRAASAALDRQGDPCALVREVVQALRKWHHYSGA